MKGKGLFLKMHVVFGRNLGKVPGYETEAGLVKIHRTRRSDSKSLVV